MKFHLYDPKLSELTSLVSLKTLNISKLMYFHVLWKVEEYESNEKRLEVHRYRLIYNYVLMN